MFCKRMNPETNVV